MEPNKSLNASPAPRTSGSLSQKASSSAVQSASASAAAVATAQNPAKQSGKTEFVATLSVFDLVIYGLVFMVPIAPFAIYAQLFDTSGGMPTLAYLIGGIAMIFTAFSFGVMVPRFPSSGSIYTYTAKGIGTGVGFVTGWLMILQYIITPDVMFIMAGNAMSAVPGLEHFPVWGWCLLFLAFTTFVAIRGIGATMVLDRIALVGELVVLGLFIGFTVAFILQGHNDAAFSVKALYNAPKFDVATMFAAVSLCALSYTGFGSVATLTEESKDGVKGPGKAMIIIVVFLAVLFCATCFVATCADPNGEIMKAHPTNGFYVLAAVAGGEWLAIACEIAQALALGIFTGLAAQTSIARILYVMAKSGAMPKRLGEMNKKNNTPVVATVSVSIVSLVMLVPLLFIGQANAAEFSNFGALASYCLLNFVVVYFCFFKKKEHKIVRHLILPVLGVVFTLAILFTLDTIPKIVGVAWLVLGIVVYLLATKKFHHVIDLSDAPSS